MLLVSYGIKSTIRFSEQSSIIATVVLEVIASHAKCRIIIKCRILIKKNSCGIIEHFGCIIKFSLITILKEV
jgi:hypothetical protein